jgi:hypothetical protein
MHNEEMHYFYSSQNIVTIIRSRRMGKAGPVPRMGEVRDVYKFSVGKPEWKRLLGVPTSWWEQSIKMNLRETKRDDVDCIHQSQKRD